MALTRAGIIYKYFSPSPAPSLRLSLSRFVLPPSLRSSSLSRAHLGRYINVNPARAFLRSPFSVVCTARASLSLSLPPSSHPSPRLSFRLCPCPSSCSPWPVNLTLLCDREFMSRYATPACVAKRDRYLTYPLYSCPMYLAITPDAGSIAQLSVRLFCSLCVCVFFHRVSNLTRISHAIESHRVIESSWFPAENNSCAVSTGLRAYIRARNFHFSLFHSEGGRERKKLKVM